MTHEYDVYVLGAGPGGYVATIRAAQLGLKTCIIERHYRGGVCLNAGCIPTKSLLRGAELTHIVIHEADTFGIQGKITVDYGEAFSRSRQVSERTTKGIHLLVKKNKIKEFNGWDTFVGAHTIDVASDNSATTRVTFNNAIIAAGSTTKMLPGIRVSANVVTCEEQILADRLPNSIVIGGSGAVGTEFAYVLRSHGVDVTIIEFFDRVVPNEDTEISAGITGAYRKLGIKVLTVIKMELIEDTGSGVRVIVSPTKGGVSQVLKADRFLSAVGFAPRTKGYGLENTGIALTERGAIVVDNYPHTNAPGVYAIGDCTVKMILAHVVEAQSMAATETIVGVETHPVDYDMIPRTTYCQPQIASFGYTEQQVRDKGHEVKVSKFPFAANGKAWGLGEGVGFIKLVADARYNELLDAHIIGPDVTELLPELILAQNYKLTADEIAHAIHAHPILSEAIKEAAHGIDGHMISL